MAAVTILSESLNRNHRIIGIRENRRSPQYLAASHLLLQPFRPLSAPPKRLRFCIPLPEHETIYCSTDSLFHLPFVSRDRCVPFRPRLFATPLHSMPFPSLSVHPAIEPLITLHQRTT